MPDRRSLLTALALLPLWPQAALARSPEIFAPNGIALGGRDPVAYAQGRGPVAGAVSHAVMWRGAVWHFVSTATMEAFEMDPVRYCPAFGGYCAWALAQGYLAPTVPEAFSLHEGRLFLNASLEVRGLWRADIDRMVALGDTHWPGVLDG